MKSGSSTPKGLHFLCLSPGDLKSGCSAETVDVPDTQRYSIRQTQGINQTRFTFPENVFSMPNKTRFAFVENVFRVCRNRI